MTNTSLPSVTNTSLPGTTATPCTLSFSDVLPTYLFYADIQFLTCLGIVSGYPDGTFRAASPTNRGQFAKIVVNGFGLAAFTPTLPTFSDVPTSYPFYPYIEAATHAGVMVGYSGGTFQTGRNVNRIETVVTHLGGSSVWLPDVKPADD